MNKKKINAYKIVYKPWSAYPNLTEVKVVKAESLKAAAEKITTEDCVSIELIGEFCE